MITKELMKKRKKWWKILLTPFFPFVFLWFFIGYLLTPPIYRPGIHVISGNTGSGKTLLADIATKHLKKKYKKPILSNSKYSDNVWKIDMLDYFGDFQQKKEITNSFLVFDEIAREFNRRLNRSNEYNATFLPLVQLLQIHRHAFISHVYLLTQSWEQADIQLQNITQRIHFVRTSKVPSYRAWLRQKRMKPIVRPRKIKYYTKNKTDIMRDDFTRYDKQYRRGKEVYKKSPLRSVKVRIDDLIDFDTHAYRHFALIPPHAKAKGEAKAKGQAGPKKAGKKKA